MGETLHLSEWSRIYNKIEMVIRDEFKDRDLLKILDEIEN